MEKHLETGLCILSLSGMTINLRDYEPNVSVFMRGAYFSFPSHHVLKEHLPQVLHLSGFRADVRAVVPGICKTQMEKRDES